MKRRACFIPQTFCLTRSPFYRRRLSGLHVKHVNPAICCLESVPGSSSQTYARRTFLHSCAHLICFSALNSAIAEQNNIAITEESSEAKDTTPQQQPVADIDPRNAEPEITDKVYFDMSLDGEAVSRITIGLYGAIAPETVENFKALAREGYTGTSIYRVVPGLTVQLGDVLRNGGRSGRSAAADGKPFPEESFRVMHSIPGMVSMVHDRNGLVDSRFFINTRPGDSGYLDGKYCAFGRVVDNMTFFYEVERAAEKGSKFAVRTPKVTIINSGVLP